MKKTDNIQQWVVSGLLGGASVEQLRSILLRSGFSASMVDKEIIFAEPYVAAAYTIKQQKQQAAITREKYDALLKTLDYQLRAIPAYLAPQKTKLPPFKEFIEEYYYPNRLGVFTSVLDDCEAKDWTPRNLIDKVGENTIVEIQAGRAGVATRYDNDKDQFKKNIEFKAFIDMLETSGPTNDFYMSGANYLFNKEPLAPLKKVMEKIGGGEYLAPDTYPEYKMDIFIGPQSTVSTLHFDTVNNLFVQIYGRKQLKLVPALQVPYLYNREYFNSTDFDFTNPQLEQYPEFAKATVIELILGPGDCVFIPIGWWHHVTSLSTSISVAGTNINIPHKTKNMFFNCMQLYGMRKPV